MKMIDMLKLGLRNLGRRKARTALTVMGVVIGTISIVIMISIGIGMNENYTKQVMQLGSLNTITVGKYQDVIDSDGNYVDYKEQQINDALIEQIKALDHVKVVSGVVEGNVQLVARGKYQAGMSIYVMDKSTFEDFDFPPLANGSYNEEANFKKPTIFVGPNILKYYFYNPKSRNYEQYEVQPTDPVTLTIQNWEYQQDPKKKSRKYPVNMYVFDCDENSEYNYNTYMDKSEYERLYHEYLKTLNVKDRKKAEKKMREYNNIKVCVDNVKYIDEVQEKIKELGFYSSSLTQYTKSSQETSKMLQMVLGGVGAVAMLVSAISIANTMVMSIYERTKEIGVMKVLGCYVRDVKRLFLFEAAMIGLIGGIIGIIISYIMSFFINKFGGKLFETIMSTGSLWGMTGEGAKFSIIPFWLPVAAAGFAMLVGVVSGFAPANKATKISAIEAMRNE